MKVVVVKLESMEEEKKFEEFINSFANRNERDASTEISIETDKSMICNVTDFLNKIGLKSSLKGYDYIREAVIKCLMDKNFLNSGVTKGIYPYVAKKFNTSSGRVERAIRNAIENAWLSGNKGMFEKMFCYCKKRPTNSEFLAKIIDYIRLYELE